MEQEKRDGKQGDNYRCSTLVSFTQMDIMFMHEKKSNFKVDQLETKGYMMHCPGHMKFQLHV